MSARVSTSVPDDSACSGLMYAGVPIAWPHCVSSVFSVSCVPSAFAMPKSMIFGCGTSSCSVTSTFDGLRSRWITPFWCACCTAWHTAVNSSRRWRTESLCASQNSLIGSPRTSSIAKYGCPVSVVPALSTFAMPGWFMRASVCRSASKRAITSLESSPARTTLSATRRRTEPVSSAS